MDNSMSTHAISPLLKRCVLTVVEHLPLHIHNVSDLPPNLKDKLRHLMSKRGLLTDDTINKVLHKGVRIVDLSESDDISDVALKTLATSCSQLCKIDLNASKGLRTHITAQGMTILAERCPYLQVVYLRRCAMLTDDAIVALSQHCQLLRDLNIGGCELITDKSLQMLGDNCPSLRSVNFSYAKVTDEGVISLVNSKCSQSLKEIHMSSCNQLTDEAVEAVVQFCPNISILLFSSCPLLTDRSRMALEELGLGKNKIKQVTWTVY